MPIITTMDPRPPLRTETPLLPPGHRHPRGLIPSPPHKLLAAEPFRPFAGILAAPNFAMVPKQLSYWGNSRYGCCVSTEEAFAKACDSPEDFITEAEVISWAGQHGLLNGADLSSVMDLMAKGGFSQNNNTYGDGPYKAVDYSNLTLIQTAISTGNQGGGAPLKVAIDASALPSGAGNSQGWYSFGGSPGQYRNTDHCISYSGYGTAAFCFNALGVPLPSGVDPNKPDCVIAFTWSTMGVVDHPWIMSTTTEEYVRSPTSIINGQPVPPPGPPTPPGPVYPPDWTPTYEAIKNFRDALNVFLKGQ